MYFHLLLQASIFSQSKHPYRSVPSLNYRYCTVDVIFWQLGSTSRLNPILGRCSTMEDDLLKRAIILETHPIQIL